jgi:hypothetical protein
MVMVFWGVSAFAMLAIPFVAGLQKVGLGDTFIGAPGRAFFDAGQTETPCGTASCGDTT